MKKESPKTKKEREILLKLEQLLNDTKPDHNKIPDKKNTGSC